MTCWRGEGNMKKGQLQVHTVVEHPLTFMSQGRISCRPIGVEPFRFSWTGPHNAPVTTNALGSEAYDVGEGRYRVLVTDGMGDTADLTLDVEAQFTAGAIVQEYRVTPASTSTSRDGSVEAIGIGLESGWRFLWTHGTETVTPVLNDVPCGTYVMMPISNDNTSSVLHLAPPAKVTVG